MHRLTREQSPRRFRAFHGGAGQKLYIQWSDPNDTGNDDGLAIDDLTFSAMGTTNTNPTIGAHSGTFLEDATASEVTTAMLSTTNAEQAASSKPPSLCH